MHNSLDATWAKVFSAMLKAAVSSCGYQGNHFRQQWISQRSMDLLEERQQIPAGSNHNNARRELRHELKRSLRSDRVDWWTTKVQEMEAAGNAGNFGELFQLIRSTGPRSMGVSETIAERDGTVITNRRRRLSRWAEYFEEQFSWPASTISTSAESQYDVWPANLDAPSKDEIRSCISSMKRNKAAGPDELPPALFKDDVEVLYSELAKFLQIVWQTETVPGA